MSPLISVLMPAYNVESFISEAVESVLSQTFTDFELIISDDCSSDNTFSCLQRLAAKDRRIRLYRQRENLGFVKNKNFLLLQANGSYIIFHDSDDLSDQRLLETTYANLKKTRFKLSVSGFARIVKVNNSWIVPIKNKHKQTDAFTSELQIFDKPMRVYPFMFANIMFDKSLLVEVGAFDEYFNRVFGEDFYWLTKAISKYPIVFDPTVLYLYRYHSTSTTNILNSPRKLIMSQVLELLFEQQVTSGSNLLERGQFEQLAELEAELLKNGKALGRQYQIWAAKAVDKGQLWPAIGLIYKSLQNDPLNFRILITIAYLVRRLQPILVSKYKS